MSLQAGQTLLHYRLVQKIGEGGMGEVWLGKDVRLDRDVAVKILPAGFSTNEQFLARFEREGKTISSLNHPNICTLYDIGREGDTHFLVMERLEGESLADRLKNHGPLPVHEVLEIGAQIASALAAAHRAGIVHRDLKPDNVMLTRMGGAKLLDFGLAKTASEAPAPIDGLTSLPTQAKALTTEGTILGTFQYMAPEQLEGLEADARTDIFALGAVLYEMATGRRAFEGQSKTSLIAAIVSSTPPPISSVQSMMPPALDHVVRKCLEKDPDDRWESAGDVASQLRWIDEAGSQAGVATAVVTSRRKRRNLMAAVAVTGWALAAMLLVWTVVRLASSTGGREVLRAELAFGPGVIPGRVVNGHVALSPDGSRLAFGGVFQDDYVLVVRDLGTGEIRGLEGTNGAGFPFWSPDSRWLAFFADGKLKKIDADGGPVQVLADAPAGRGGTWSRDGVVVFAADIQGPLLAVSENGGTTTPVTSPALDKITHRMPHFLPDGTRFLFIERESRDQRFGNISQGSVDGSGTRVVVEKASNPQYADGFLFFVRDGNLMAQRFDPGALEAVGALVPVADSLEYYNPRDIGNYSVIPSGLLVYRKRSLRDTALAWFDFDGVELESIGEPGYLYEPRANPDGDLIALDRFDPSRSVHDIWIMDLGRKQLTRATFIEASESPKAVFSPDGERLAVASFATAETTKSALWIQGLTGGGSREMILESTNFLVTDWSRDGRYLIGTVQETETGHDVAYLDLEGPREVQPLVSTPYVESAALISPDGSWIVYTSNETGGFQTYLTDFPEGRRKWQISTSQGFEPSWSPDGKEVYFGAEGGLWAVSVSGDAPGAVRIGSPRKILDFEKPGFDGVMRPIKIETDRFLSLKFASDETREPIRLIRNWKHELER